MASAIFWSRFSITRFCLMWSTGRPTSPGKRLKRAAFGVKRRMRRFPSTMSIGTSTLGHADEVAVGGVELGVPRLHLLVESGELLVGGLKFLLRGLKLLVQTLQLFVAGYELFAGQELLSPPVFLDDGPSAPSSL